MAQVGDELRIWLRSSAGDVAAGSSVRGEGQERLGPISARAPVTWPPWNRAPAYLCLTQVRSWVSAVRYQSEQEFLGALAQPFGPWPGLDTLECDSSAGRIFPGPSREALEASLMDSRAAVQ